MSIEETIGISLLGMTVVFLVLVILMFVIRLFTAILTPSKKLEAEVAEVPATVKKGVPLQGGRGEINIFDVPDPTSAMLMAIVADEIGAPLNELSFLSIKQVEDESR